MNTSNQLAGLRRRFPGLENKLGAMIADMADHESQVNGYIPKKVRGWIEVRPADPRDPLDAFVQAHWTAFLHARVLGGDHYSVPVIPDEHNPRADKIVNPDDQPYVFTLMREAEDAARRELPGFVAYIERQL